MDLTIITPTTGTPELAKNMRAVGEQGIKHLVVWDGHPFPFPSALPEYPDTRHVVLHSNTGKHPETGKVHYYGHRIYSGFTFLVNTKWVMFLDEDNHITPDFAEKIAPLLAERDGDPAVTFRRIITTKEGDVIGKDDFEAIPTRFADTGTIIWNTRFFAEHIAGRTAFTGWGNDRRCYSALIGTMSGKMPKHLHEYLLVYTAPTNLYDYFRTNCTPIEGQAGKRWHDVEGWFDGLDYATYEHIVSQMPDNFRFLEIGAYKGRSLCALAEIASRYGKTCTADVIDLFDGDIHIAERDYYAEFRANTEHLTIIGNVHKGDSAIIHRILPKDTRYDAIFIDGLHTADGVELDIRNYLPFLAQGGILSGHDYMRFGVAEGVRRVLGGDHHQHGNCWIHTKK
jgi:hypothetical protein